MGSGRQSIAARLPKFGMDTNPVTGYLTVVEMASILSYLRVQGSIPDGGKHFFVTFSALDGIVCKLGR